MSSTMNITVSGVNVDVNFDAHKGYPGTREDPPEPAYVEITAVSIGQEEVTDVLSAAFMEKLQTAVEEALAEPDVDGPDRDICEDY